MCVCVCVYECVYACVCVCVKIGKFDRMSVFYHDIIISLTLLLLLLFFPLSFSKARAKLKRGESLSLPLNFTHSDRPSFSPHRSKKSERFRPTGERDEVEMESFASHDCDDGLMDEEETPDTAGSDFSSRVSGVMNRISGILSRSNEEEDEDEIDEVFLRKRHADIDRTVLESPRARMSETTRRVMESRKTQH